MKRFTPSQIHNLLSQLQNQQFVFLETGIIDQENQNSFLFTEFEQIITFSAQDDIEQFFQTIEEYSQQGKWLSGYFSYEFGYCLEPKLRHLLSEDNSVLAWIGVCSQPQQISEAAVDFENDASSIILRHKPKTQEPVILSETKDRELFDIPRNHLT